MNNNRRTFFMTLAAGGSLLATTAHGQAKAWPGLPKKAQSRGGRPGPGLVRPSKAGPNQGLALGRDLKVAELDAGQVSELFVQGLKKLFKSEKFLKVFFKNLSWWASTSQAHGP